MQCLSVSSYHVEWYMFTETGVKEPMAKGSDAPSHSRVAADAEKVKPQC